MAVKLEADPVKPLLLSVGRVPYERETASDAVFLRRK